MGLQVLHWSGFPPEPCRHGVVSIGNFDGVHLGHVALFRETRAVARQVGGPVVAITFDPHPLTLLAPDRYQLPLTTLADRADQLQAIGVDEVVVLQTGPELLALGPEAFFEDILQRAFAVRGVVEGFNFRFGRHRSGSNATLDELCRKAGIVFREVPAFTLHGEPVSSSRVREALLTGNVQTAMEFLQRSYRIRGRVIEGAKRGRTIGFPTANLGGIETLLPGEGVYAVTVRCQSWSGAGAANIGPNPTFGEAARKIEIHLLDFSGDLYGQQLTVEFLERIRPVHVFPSVDALQQQLARDIAATRAIWARVM